MTEEDKHLASKIFKILKKEKMLIKKNEEKIDLSHIKKKIINLGIKKIDYIEALNLKSLKKAKKSSENFNIFSAFYIKKVRLIDNF